MRKLTIILLILLIWLQYSLWFGKNGICDYIRINNDVIAQQNNNIKLKIRNNQLFDEIDNLINGLEVIEECARNELGMIKFGEIFYRLIPESNVHKNEHNKHAKFTKESKENNDCDI